MRHPLFNNTGGFTFIELMVVVVILAMLATFALLDYNVSIKKARLTIATEEVVALLEEAQVNAQTSYSVPAESDDEEDSVVCWALQVDVAEAGAQLLTLPWTEDDATCFPRDEADWTEERSTQWSREIGWKEVIVTTQAESGSTTQSLSTILLVFTPPRGDLHVYRYDQSSATLQEDVSSVRFQLYYAESDDPIYNAAVDVKPVTGSFVVVPGTDID